jgi:hypothetical protein
VAISEDSIGVLLDVLRETRTLLASSTESDWAALTPEEVIDLLDRQIASLRAKKRVHDAGELSSLFAPTAEIQEIAMANEWSERYIELSSRFDAAMEPVSR